MKEIKDALTLAALEQKEGAPLLTEEKEAVKPSIVNNEDTEIHERYDDVYTIYTPNTICEAEREGQAFDFCTQNGIKLYIHVLSTTIFRFRYAPQGHFAKDFSYAIAPDFKEQAVAIDFIEKDHYFLIATPDLHCRIAKSDMKVSLWNTDGVCINEAAAGYSAKSTILKGFESIEISKKAPLGEQYLGFGDKTCALDLRGQSLENWNTDAFAYGEKTDPLYRSIPFYYGLKDGIAYGIFMDNTYRSTFDFAKTEKETLTFTAAGGEMNYYFIYGPELMHIARQYAQLTGTAALPPLWALGFHQCRWSYYPESRVRTLAAEFRSRQIPCDAIYLDIDYMDDYRCFTWDKNHFPDMKTMVSDLSADGFNTIVMIDPGIKAEKGYSIYEEGLAKDAYCRRPDGTLMVGPVWPEACVFPDFTDPEVRAWWGECYTELYKEVGVSGFWNDMNEPAVFKVNSKTFPEDIMHNYDGNPCHHKKAHNIYGMQMARASVEGLQAISPELRPFVLTRATFSGGQRFAAVWTGDNLASWEHLHIANVQCQRLSLSGYSFVGTDIGGFVDEPTGELLARWLQLAIFHPVFRIHSMGNREDGSAGVSEEAKQLDLIVENRMDQEPWSFGEAATAWSKAAIELRYQLLPYIYTAFYQHTQLGNPVLRSLAFYDQKDVHLKVIEREFMFGDQLLVSPVEEEGAITQTLYLPKGEWYNYWTSEQLAGQKQHTVAAPMHQIPLFVKAGTVLPHHPVRQHTKEAFSELTLYLYVGNGVSELYEDAGDGFGATKLTTFDMREEGEQLIVKTKITGDYKPAYNTIKIQVHGWEKKTCQVVLNKDKKVENIKQLGVNVFEFVLADMFDELLIAES